MVFAYDDEQYVVIHCDFRLGLPPAARYSGFRDPGPAARRSTNARCRCRSRVTDDLTRAYPPAYANASAIRWRYWTAECGPRSDEKRPEDGVATNFPSDWIQARKDPFIQRLSAPLRRLTREVDDEVGYGRAVDSVLLSP